MKKMSISKSIIKGYLVLVTLMVLVILSPGTTADAGGNRESHEIIPADIISVENDLHSAPAGYLWNREIESEMQSFYQQVDNMVIDNTLPETGIQEEGIFIDADSFTEESGSLLTNREWNRVIEQVLRNA